MKLTSIAPLIAALPLLTTSCSAQKTAEFPKFSAEAHRGGRGLMPENTIVAMKNAMTIDGITTLEMDTHITKDGKVVVTHDDYLSPAFMLTPEGNEIADTDARKYPIYKLSYAELKKFDLGTKYYDLFPRQKKIKTHISLLSDLIDSVQMDIKTNHRKQFFYNIETKSSEKGDGITNPEPAEFVQLLMSVLQKKKILPYVVIQSFDKRTIQLINQKYPDVRTSYLVSNKKTYAENMSELGYKPFILSPAWQMVNEDMVSKAHADGVKVIPWTPNTAEDIEKLKALNVDGIISDYPDVLVRAQ